MYYKVVSNVPELLAEAGFSGAVDYVVRQGGDYLLGEILTTEAQATWVRMWMTSKFKVKDPHISQEDEKKLWENFELLRKERSQ